jgi:type IX secretion system PorP/SprF family membrane protein
MYVGLSTTHITETSMENLNIDMARHYYIMAGYDFQINSQFTLKPAVFAKTDAASTQIDLNCSVLYNNMVWLGVSYRTADAIAPMVGFQKEFGGNSMLKIGYSYDVTTSQIKDYSSGSHEIMLNYCFKIVPPSKVQKYKNVRFL